LVSRGSRVKSHLENHHHRVELFTGRHRSRPFLKVREGAGLESRRSPSPAVSVEGGVTESTRLRQSWANSPPYRRRASSYHSAYKSIRSDAVPHPNRCATGACEPGKSDEPSQHTPSVKDDATYEDTRAVNEARAMLWVGAAAGSPWVSPRAARVTRACSAATHAAGGQTVQVHTAFGAGVLHVVGVGSDAEMRRIAARRIVAAMHDFLPIGETAWLVCLR
jgi:hypothetical protein